MYIVVILSVTMGDRHCHMGTYCYCSVVVFVVLENKLSLSHHAQTVCQTCADQTLLSVYQLCRRIESCPAVERTVKNCF